MYRRTTGRRNPWEASSEQRAETNAKVN